MRHDEFLSVGQSRGIDLLIRHDPPGRPAYPSRRPLRRALAVVLDRLGRSLVGAARALRRPLDLPPAPECCERL